MCTIEKLTTENGIQVSVNSSYAIDIGYNAISLLPELLWIKAVW